MATATTDTGTGGRFRALGTLTGAVGVAFSASWITSMLVGAPMLDVDATGTAIVDTVTGREGALFAQYLFSEGLPAIGIAVISFALARAAATARTATALRALGLAAALLSLVQFTCGAWLSASAVPNGDTGLAGDPPGGLQPGRRRQDVPPRGPGPHRAARPDPCGSAGRGSRWPCRSPSRVWGTFCSSPHWRPWPTSPAPCCWCG